MRQEEEPAVSDIPFEGNVGQEKDKLMSALQASPSGQIFLDQILVSEDGTTLVTRRHAALAFSGLLVLEAERKVCATQDHFFGQILVKMI